jgi:galactosamine-6-phosphate isomerase
MKINVLDSYEEVSRHAASIITAQAEKNKELLICAATGNSPTRTYAVLQETNLKRPGLFSSINIIKLDEWGGIPMDHEGTCESYLQKHLIGPLAIDHSRYISFLSNPKNPKEECERIENALNAKGAIDICILGLGMNGHIALNEPAESLKSHAHVATLSTSSLTHPMISGSKKPTYGLTLGVADIFQSKMILMLISGSKKKEVTREFLSGTITTQFPASLLWLHSNTVCIVDKDAYEK